MKFNGCFRHNIDFRHLHFFICPPDHKAFHWDRICWNVLLINYKMFKNTFGKHKNKNYDEIQYKCVVRYLDDNDPVTVSYEVENELKIKLKFRLLFLRNYYKITNLK